MKARDLVGSALLAIAIGITLSSFRAPAPTPKLDFTIPDVSADVDQLLLQVQELEQQSQEFSQGAAALLSDAESLFNPEPLCVLPTQCIEVTP